ncbi:MAG TPA: tellurite resistance TerB family protein [Myxococcaceae bacterium]|nr:tellurite resistance TerB family protein [Myxococcaceae bacterium]
MSPQTAAANRVERNAALVEVMLLAAMADGQLTEGSIQALLRRVLERPEFDGTAPEEISDLVEQSVKRLASESSLETILQQLRERLPTHQNRLLAFGLAAAIALADQRATRAEIGLLKTFQAALGISEDEVAELVDVVESGRSLNEVLGEPLERLYAEVMVLVTAADGKVKPAESRALIESLASDPLFQEIDAARAQSYLSASVEALVEQGLPERLRVLAHGLTTHSQRVRAFGLAVRIAQSSGKPSAAELRILDMLQATFGLADDEVARLRADGQ